MIKYHKRLKQLYDFEGMGKGKISPTDIDAVLEFGNKFLFLFEFKLEGKENDIGKKIALERIADSWNKKSNDSLAMVIYCTHNIPAEETVYCNKDLTVVLTYFNSKYIDETSSLKDYLSRIGDFYNIPSLMS
tara:strand:- start:657 stop:1052 length:396 start_codon:yes stop_codon:yes gene_type:complete